VHGILVPGGFGARGVEGKINASQWAREQRIPYFGICYGMQMAVIDVARHVAGLADADTTENNERTPHPVICLLDSQQKVVDKGGTMRLGAQPCRLVGGHARAAYGQPVVSERHRHRYEFNPAYREQLAKAGLVVTGVHDGHDLAEIVEIPDHPWFVAVQYHPEFKSKPTKAHPLFAGFIRAALTHARESATTAAAR
jgi:CTP synthase